LPYRTFMTKTRLDTGDERGLLAAARARDERAFGHLVECHRRGLELYCYLMLGCRHRAKDVVEETVLRAWRGHERVEPSASARGWLYGIATHACLGDLGCRR
jgi:RNA polymerase sigma-70 factor (ECF subfamily)